MKEARIVTILMLTTFLFGCMGQEPTNNVKAFAQEWSKEHFAPLKRDEKTVILKYLKAEMACIKEFENQEAQPLARLLRFIGIATDRRYQHLRSYPTGLKAAKDLLPLSSAATKSYITLQAKLKAYCEEKMQELTNNKYFALYEAQEAEKFLQACIKEAEMKEEFLRELQKTVNQQ